MKRSELKSLIKEIFKQRLNLLEVSANKYTVIYAIAGLENIDQSEHDNREQALNAARSFIQSYNTSKSKLAGERMVHIDDGYCLKDESGATVGIATIIDPRGRGEERMQELKRGLQESIGKVMETTEDDEALYVEYLRDIQSEVPFTMRTPSGNEKFQFVMARYPSGKEDIAVYATRGDLVYGYQTWRKMHGIS